jgi:glycosyltransferase involved in cell wall biosynthesis
MSNLDSTDLYKSNILVSVITPNFNGAKFINRCVECVRRQNFALELIIVDDFSTDNSWLILIELAKKYSWLKPIKLQKNSGPAVARNKAIGLASGRYLAFLDIDDFWLPHKIKTQIDFMNKNKCAVSYSHYRFVNEDASKVGRRLQGYNQIGWHLHHMTRYLGCLTIMIDRTKVLDFKIPDLDPEYRVEDFNAWSQCISKYGPIFCCPHDLARYTVSAGSRSANGKKAALSVWDFYRNKEKINLLTSSLYFTVYVIGVFWKRYRYRPIYKRDLVDKNNYWSILP